MTVCCHLYWLRRDLMGSLGIRGLGICQLVDKSSTFFQTVLAIRGGTTAVSGVEGGDDFRLLNQNRELFEIGHCNRSAT
jgi:hypothetical protein